MARTASLRTTKLIYYYIRSNLYLTSGFAYKISDIIPRLFQNPDENQSDIEVISNPPSESEPIIIMDQEGNQPPRLLYSEVLQKPAALESDIEFVPEPLSPELEFDDEEYLNEVLRTAKISSDSESAASSSSESEPDDDTCTFPANIHEMSPAMTEEEMDAREVVLEVNLTLLSFTIVVGVSGLSGFLLGGIYSAVLTNNINHTTDLAEYPGTLPVCYRFSMLFVFVFFVFFCFFFCFATQISYIMGSHHLLLYLYNIISIPPIY